MTAGEAGAILRHIQRLAETQTGQGLTDGQLLQRFAEQGEEGAFAGLLHRHGRLVWAVCRHILHHEHDAEDAFQATFLVLARRAGSIRKAESVGSWLHGVAHRIALKAKQMAVKRKARERLAAAPERAQTVVDPAWHELQAILDEELRRLPEKYRAPFIGCCLEGRSRKEAAAEFGWKEGTLSSRIAEARRRLQERLARRGVVMPAALTAGVLWGQTASATVPPALVQTTIVAGASIAAGREVGGLVSANVAALVKAGTKAALGAKLTLGTALILAAGLAAGSTGLMLRQAPLAPATPKKQPAHELAEQKPEQPKSNEEQKLRFDLFGDPLPAEAIARLGTVRLRHGELVNYLAFSPDAKQLISQSDIIRVWETATGRELRHFTPLPGHKLGAASLSPDGKVLAVGSLMNESDPIVLCEVATGRNLKKFGKGQYELVTFSPDGKTLAASESRRGRFELWDVATGQRLRAWDAHSVNVPGVVFADQAYAVAFARDGKTLLTSGRDKRVCFWDVATGRQTGEIKDCPTLWTRFGRATQVSLSPDGSRLAAIRPQEDNQLMPVNQIGIWDAATGKELCQLRAPKEEIASADWSGFWAVAWTANGKLVTAGPDDSVRIWDPVAARQLRRIRNASRFSLAVSRDGKHVAAGGQSIRVLDLTKDPPSDFSADRGAPGPPGDVAVNGELAVTAHGYAVLWDAATGKELRRLQHPSGIASVHLSADGRILFAACGDNRVRAWDTTTGREKADFELKKAELRSQRLARTPDGKLLLAVARDDGDIDVFNAVTAKKEQHLKGHQSYIYGLAFTPEARTLVVGFEDRTVEVRDVATGKKLRQFSLPEDDQGPVGTIPVGKPVFTAALSPDGKLLAFGSQDRYLVLKDMVTGQDIRRVDQLPDGVCPLAFSPDGKTLAWAGWMMGYAGWKDPTIHLVEVLTGRERHMLCGHGGRVHGLAFSGDGKRLISAGDDTTALIWDLTGEISASGRWGRPLAPREIEAAWVDLGNDDTARAFRAICRLAASPNEAIPYFQKHLKAVPAVGDNRLAQLIADLDSNQFAARQSATKELGKLGDLAAPACQKALEQKPSIEVRRRLEALLEKQRREERKPSADRLQLLRAVEVLEQMATTEAKQVLASLSQGAAEARLTQEAKASLNRLTQPSAGP